MGNMVVIMADGTKYEVNIVKFERKFDVPVSKLQEEQRYEWLLYLAWLGAKRNGVTDDYDTWIGLVEELDVTGSSDNLKA
jgi:hypothetical protein